MQEINVEKIMEEIRQEIKEKGYTEDMLSFYEIPVSSDVPVSNTEDGNTFSGALNQLRGASYIVWKRPLPDGVKGLVKKIIRKCICFVVGPITDDQNVYNGLNITLIEQLCNTINEQKEKIEELEKRISTLEKR